MADTTMNEDIFGGIWFTLIDGDEASTAMIEKEKLLHITPVGDEWRLSCEMPVRIDAQQMMELGSLLIALASKTRTDYDSAAVLLEGYEIDTAPVIDSMKEIIKGMEDGSEDGSH